MRLYLGPYPTLGFQKYPAYYEAGTGPAPNGAGWGGVGRTDKIVQRNGDFVIQRNLNNVTPRVI
jgi:hypothetical protein